MSNIPLKPNNIINPKIWIKNVKELTSRINKDYPKNTPNNITNKIFKNSNGSIDIEKIKNTIVEFEKKLGTITSDLESIKKYINAHNNINYKTLDLNNIEQDSMRDGIDRRLERLNTSKNLLENFLDIINNSKKTYINSIKEDIENNYNTSLENYKKNLEDNTVKINALIDLTNNAANNNLIKRKKNITNIFESKNNTREKII